MVGKTVCENYKTKSTRRTMPEEQFVFEGAVPAIIDEETWHNVQRLRETKRRTPKRSNAPNRLTGLLYCADCGAKLTHHNSLVQGKYIDDAFTCSRYRAPMEDCTIHYVATQKLEAAILSAIQRIAGMSATTSRSLFSGFERHPVCARRKQSRIAGNRLSRRRSATPNWTDW